MASDPRTAIQVPYTSDEPVFFLIARISTRLEEDQKMPCGRELIVKGASLVDESKSADFYRILGNAFTYLSRPASGHCVNDKNPHWQDH